MADVLTEIDGVKLTIRTVGIVTAVLVLILFILLRIAMNKKTAAETQKIMRWLDGIGFGLLPAAAVWKIFEERYSGAGREVFEPLPLIPGLTENGKFIPGSIEAAAALLCFAGICLWLIIRKEEMAGTGDLLIVSLCLWSGIRIVRYVYCAAVLVCRGIWTARQLHQTHAKQRIAGNWVAAILCTAMIVLTASGTLSVGSAIGDLAVILGCAVLMVLLTLLCGSDSRQWEAFQSTP